ncbi:MAG: hypothetical protein AAGM04_07105 [Pseudomonadota bacterium]
MMTRSTCWVLVCAFAATLETTPVYGSNFLKLDKTSTKKLQTIGRVPPKRKKELNLGPLRTVEAKLPGGVRTFEERMKMRVQRAIDREEAVSNALRN